MLAPICLFTYNRPFETRIIVEALEKNYLASKSEIFIFSDGPKNERDSVNVKEVRKFLKNISGFKSVTIYESPENKGLANSIIEGVSKVIKKFEKVIVLEDDLVSTPNFLDFMNQALNFYCDNSKIHSISGYSLKLPSLKDYNMNFYLAYRASSWGWATWKNKWEDIDWHVKEYNSYKKNPLMQIKFMRGGSDMPKMLKNQMNGKIDSWAIRWCFDQFLKNQLTVFPKISKLYNIGIGDNATHTKKTKRFITEIDNGTQRNFMFNNELLINKQILKEFRAKFSLISRFKDKYF